MSSGQDFHGKIISLIGKVRYHSAQRKAKKGNAHFTSLPSRGKTF